MVSLWPQQSRKDTCYLVAEPGEGGGEKGRRYSLGVRRVSNMVLVII